MDSTTTRRDWMRLASAGAAGALQLGAQSASPSGALEMRVTAGDKRFAAQPPVPWEMLRGDFANSIRIDPSSQYQDMVGFGAAFTDAACWTFNQLAEDARQQLFHELFHPSQLGLGAGRLCIGSSDYSRSVYSFDDGPPDPELKRFSIDHDRAYILPMLRLARQMKPDLYLFGSPWSPPGWMKDNGTMLGGTMRKQSFPAYARYFVKFLQAYREAGVPVNAVSVQNEVDAEQEGHMPACLWSQEQEWQFVGDHLGPAFARDKIGTKIWIIDHNYDLWGRALDILAKPEVSRYIDGVAWHGYVGDPSAMTRVHDAYPAKHAYWTEGGPDYTAPDYLTDWAKWGGTFAGILRNWARCIIGWNLALDEKGKPNIGPFPCGGVVEIDSATRAITRSGQYWALAHYSSAIRRGARRIGSQGEIEKVSHVAFVNPDSGGVVVLANQGAEKDVVVQAQGRAAGIHLPADSLVTVTWRMGA